VYIDWNKKTKQNNNNKQMVFKKQEKNDWECMWIELINKRLSDSTNN